ncbi:type III-B CRISPR module RAMP protein Cmr1, partial [candidate division WOR-3 bacterium]|nr:type III-B CRISPR module RAMP protein Cmr1 [candidate division WOR-3 bacterium]
MENVTFKCEIITPMFMYGADGRTPEIRPSEFKGMMRFWWRAVNNYNSHHDLRKEENKIFGGTDVDKASEVKLRISPNSLRISRNNIKIRYGLKPGFKGDKDSGILYLFYSNLLKGGKPFIEPNSSLQLHLLFPRNSSPQIEDEIFSSLWLAIYLGGFGSRSRRCGGNLVVSGTSYSNGLDFFVPNKSELTDWYSKNLRKIIRRTNNKNFEYSNIIPPKVYILDSLDSKSWKDAINKIGSAYLNFRKKRRFTDRLPFGLPITGKNSAFVTINREERRRASPLVFHITKTSDNLYVPILVELKGRILPEQADVTINYRRKRWTIKGNQLEKEIIDEFVSGLQARRIEL